MEHVQRRLAPFKHLILILARMLQNDPRFHYSNSAVQESRSFHPDTINTFLANQEDNVFARSQVRGFSTLKCTIWSFSDSQKRKQLSC